jgi:hypothetical protein
MAGSITVSSITLDSDNNFSIKSNTGATILSANGTGLITGIASGSAITNAQLTTPTVSGNVNLDSTGTTGLNTATANTVRVHTAGVERIRIDSSGNMLIGATSTVGSSKFFVDGINGTSPSFQGASGAGAYLDFRNNAQTTNGLRIGQGQATGSDNVALLYNNDNAALVFGTNGTSVGRFDANGNFMLGTTSVGNVYGNFVNFKPVSTLGVLSTNTNTQQYSKIQESTPVASSTVTAFNFTSASGTVLSNNRVMGHFYVYADAIGGGNSFGGVYSIVSHGNGATDARLVSAQTYTRGSSPVTSVQIADDGAGGAIKLTITYNAFGSQVSKTSVSFIGMIN